VPKFAVDGKGEGDLKQKAASMAEKDKYCMKNFGKKYSECSPKEKAQCDRVHGKVEKASMAEKDKYCMKNFGKKYSDCSEKQKAQCDKAHGKVEKGRGGKCAECGQRMTKMGCMKMGCKMYSGKMEKGKGGRCPECGEGMNKMGCMKMGCKMYSGKMEKAQPEYTTSYSTNPQENMFVVESGGQTRSAYYTTNQHLLDSQDVANKGASSFPVNFKTLASQMNPHEGGGADRLDVEGKISKSNNSPY